MMYLGDAQQDRDGEVGRGIVQLAVAAYRWLFGGADLPAERARIDGIVQLIACDPQLSHPATRQEWAFLRCVAGDRTMSSHLARMQLIPAPHPLIPDFFCGGADERTKAYATAAANALAQRFPALLSAAADPALLVTKQPWGPDARPLVCGARQPSPGGGPYPAPGGGTASSQGLLLIGVAGLAALAFAGGGSHARAH